jgi:hypothetical protein
MMMSYSIDKDLRVVTMTYLGTPDFDEWANTMNAIFRDPKYRPGFSFVLDRRFVAAAPDKQYIKNIVAFVKDHLNELGKSHTAIVVSEMTSYEMARMSQGLLDAPDLMQIFTDIEKAKQWVSLFKNQE